MYMRTPRYTHAREPATAETSAANAICVAALDARRSTLNCRLCRTIATDATDRHQCLYACANGRCQWSAKPTRAIRLPHLPLPAPPSSPLTPHCVQSIGPGLLDRSIALYRAVAVCPCSITAVPAAAGPCKGLPARARLSILFSPHRLPPRQSGTACLPRPLLVPGPSCPPTLPLHLSCLPTGVHVRWYRHGVVRLFSRKQGSSSSLATPTVPLPPRDWLPQSGPIIKQALILLRHHACNLPAAVRSSKFPLALLPPDSRDPIHSTVPCLREERSSHRPTVVANTRFTCMNACMYTASNCDISISLSVTSRSTRSSIWQIPTHALCSKQAP